MFFEQLELNLDYQAMGLPEPTKAATLTAYAAETSPEINSKARPALVLCPGGGYAMTSDREAEPVALALVARGIQVFVLRYAVNPDRYPLALLQLAKSVLTVREQAARFNVDPQRIGVAGFSAGGHLAASFAVFWNKPFLADYLAVDADCLRPNFQMLAYPVISSGDFAHRSSFELLLGARYDELVEEMSLEEQVHTEVPKAFIWHTAADDAVPVENTLFYALALRKQRLPIELHIYDRGQHGLSLANELTETADGYANEPAVRSWLELFVEWMKRN